MTSTSRSRKLDTRDLALLRFVAQGLVAPARVAPEDVVARLLCLQAQDYRSGVISVALRSGASSAEVEATFNSGAVVRAWPLRGTLHLVRATDLAWLRDLLAPRELAAAAGREARMGITAAVLAQAERIAVETLSSGGSSSRAALIEAWSDGGVDTTNQRSYHLIWHLAHAGTLCFGPVRNGEQHLVLQSNWVPATDKLDRHAALETLAFRYFESHGPATPSDLARWANLTIADIETAVSAASRRLATVTVDDVEYLLGLATQDQLAACRREAQGVFALPGFDELLFGYRDKTPTLPDDRATAVFPHRNGVPSRTILANGQVVATWASPPKGSGDALTITPLVPLSTRVVQAAKRKASALEGNGD
ncbi:MAG TPA: winged helix DNA-binding domain-containing protein [Acidimicrobiales bacterium]|nr:winged helix DNA-binding domain-containing protein [Acidimicrobiales bacterium]